MAASLAVFSRHGLLLPLLAGMVLALGACTTYGVVANQPLSPGRQGPVYSLGEFARDPQRHSGELTLAVAFSGGGTRAAALSYGVMQELRDTRVRIDGREQRLLDAINVISSVSGGSFTSAYYGLYGDRLFADYEQRFLRSDVEGALLRGLLNPVRWFSSQGRTEMAVSYYQQTLFGNATFGDLAQRPAPLILINSSDLGSGGRFSFVQEYFDLLCSDLSSFPLARAVTASSAVPVLFEPVVAENYTGCAAGMPPWLVAAQRRDADNGYLSMVVQDDLAYRNKVTHRYAQFVDGGITDNLGLRALLDAVELAGGAEKYLRTLGIAAPRRIAIISVNAAADTPAGIGESNRAPSFEQTMNAVTNVQLDRYNVSTLQQTQQGLERWTRELSTPERPVTSYFVRLSFEDVPNLPLRRFLNRIPTSFALDKEQVERLIATGRELLRSNPEYQRLLAGLRAQATEARGTAP
ncbi:patatin-like phospholipase family protein [Variovorax ginsengisoli]|uniref:Patatin-like phospholipase family protein n=1 Tax=Variovorax ginsengisoli TaxID=363844 RepID=A0ABT8S3R3_9BURK|nr:patatin-like phospholipase family protein [Variovorax ginsengisoli]MDN8614396.1 patatin-like phospholipase family protein [Variovorax ginsengisoli]MDO1533566.1 patatin-like phospholipase family protein [Variovorax ginsengisoli]